MTGTQQDILMGLLRELLAEVRGLRAGAAGTAVQTVEDLGIIGADPSVRIGATRPLPRPETWDEAEASGRTWDEAEKAGEVWPP